MIKFISIYAIKTLSIVTLLSLSGELFGMEKNTRRSKQKTEKRSSPSSIKHNQIEEVTLEHNVFLPDEIMLNILMRLISCDLPKLLNDDEINENPIFIIKSVYIALKSALRNCLTISKHLSNYETDFVHQYDQQILFYKNELAETFFEYDEQLEITEINSEFVEKLNQFTNLPKFDLLKNNIPEITIGFLLIGANTNLKSEEDETILHSIIKNRLKIQFLEHFIYVLLFCGADVNAKNSHKKTPLILAVNANLMTIVKLLLLQENINVNMEDDTHNTPLLIACVNADWDMVKLLLIHKNIDVNVQDADLRTALMYATLFGQVEIVRALLARNADISLKNAQNETAFDIAMRKKEDHPKNKNRAEIIELLGN